MRAGSVLVGFVAGFAMLSAASAAEEKTAATGDGAGAPGVPAPTLTATVVTPVTAPVPGPAVGAAQPPPAPAGSAPATPPPVASAPAKPPATTLAVRIDLSAQTMTLRYDGAHRERWAISSGRDGHLTPRGTFRPQWAAKMWYSRKYDDAPMPHAVFFVGGVAVHGTQATRLLGQPASHGCVRLAPGHAARFYALVHKHGYKHTRIEVVGTTPATSVARKGSGTDKRRLADRRQDTPPPRVADGTARNGHGAAPRLRPAANGLIYLPPDSPYRGRETFVLNGVVYKRVR